MKTYLYYTAHSPSYNIFFAGVLLLLYEGLIRILPGEAQIINAVDAWLQMFLAQIPYGSLSMTILLVLIAIYFYFLDAKNQVEYHTGYFIGMFLESAFWAGVIFFNLSYLVTKFLPDVPMQTGGDPLNLWRQISLSLGAGFYEEFLFRFLMGWGLLLLFQTLGFGTIISKIWVILITAVLFSLVHFKFVIGSLGDEWNTYAFVFRAAFGGCMSLLLTFRGFGITAWSHALYDVYVYSFRALVGI